MILFIKHISIEGSSLLGKFFRDKGLDVAEIDLSLGDEIPKNTDNLDAVISLGGPMNVYEEDKHPFLLKENKFIQKVVKEEVPFLGICLGSQLLAKACKAKVVKSPTKEIGFYKLFLTNDGLADPLFKDLRENFDVFQWHEDMFEIPKDGKLLAQSQFCHNQAFRLGKNAYGVQFHLEVEDKDIALWANSYWQEKDDKKEKLEEILQGYKKINKMFSQNSTRIFENFYQIIKETKKQVC